LERVYGDAYRELHEAHWWWRARASLVLEVIGDLAARRPGGFPAILDVGCGDALLFARLEKFGTPEGIEADAEIVSESSAMRWRIHVGLLDASFVPRAPPDLVLMLDVIEHVDDDVALLAAARRTMRPDGVLLVTVPAGRHLWTSHDDLNHHRRRYSSRQLRASVEAAGFEVVSLRHFFHALTLPKLAVALRERAFGSKPSVPTIPREPLNAWVEKAFRLEQRLTRRLPLPFGTSLIAVARPAESVAGSR